MIRDFIVSLGNRANLALAHITPKDILAYRDSIIAANKTARTANLSVKVVSAAFNTAVRQHIVESNPATALESLPVNAFNSAMANAGTAQEIRQKLTGHTSAGKNKVYTHRELEPLRIAVAAIPSLKL